MLWPCVFIPTSWVSGALNLHQPLSGFLLFVLFWRQCELVSHHCGIWLLWWLILVNIVYLLFLSLNVCPNLLPVSTLGLRIMETYEIFGHQTCCPVKYVFCSASSGQVVAWISGVLFFKYDFRWNLTFTIYRLYQMKKFLPNPSHKLLLCFFLKCHNSIT